MELVLEDLFEILLSLLTLLALLALLALLVERLLILVNIS
jgi:hypothetical protein